MTADRLRVRPISVSVVASTIALLAAMPARAESAPPQEPGTIQPVSFEHVRVDDAFWSPRSERDQKITIPHNLDECDATGRIANFLVAAKKQAGGMVGYFFNDSDVYKVIEGAAYTLAMSADTELEARCDAVIDAIAAAQEPDGYLYTSRSILDPENMPPGGEPRWSNIDHGHELYCAGHLYEAGVAYAEATGNRKLLDVALKNADLILATFGPGKNPFPPGHPEIELGLLRLYQHTGDDRYLHQARWFVDARGQTEGRHSFGEYSQDHRPVLEQDAIVGHAVRACYLFAATTDVGRLTGDQRYVAASERLWNDMASSQVYLTGGVGSSGSNEGFGSRYELPNQTGYGETCASIANGLWSWRLFLATGDARYVDMLERVMFNAFHSGWSLAGDRFFYPNPLASRGAERQAWFGCACCPPNVDRFVPSIPGFAYATTENTLYVNLFLGGEADVEVDGAGVKVAQTTSYPWQGGVRIEVDPGEPREFAMLVRIPGWARGEPMPGGLYRFVDPDDGGGGSSFELQLNGRPILAEVQRGFARIVRTWATGDRVDLSLPMPVRRVVADDRVQSDRGLVALQRGPIVYCFEGIDQSEAQVGSLVLADDAELRPEHRADLLGGVTVIETEASLARRSLDRTVDVDAPIPVVAIPYYAWANRGRTPMAVWLARTPGAAAALPAPTLARRAKASSSFSQDLGALSDQVDPASSIDHDHPFVHWWPKKGTTEWLVYEFDAPAEIAGVEVYWFDDTGRGECRIPAAWKCLVRVDGAWRDVEKPSGYDVGPDAYRRCDFMPVRCDAIKLEVESQPKWAGGLHEWRVLPAAGGDR